MPIALMGIVVAIIVVIIIIASLEKQLAAANRQNVEQARAIAEYTRQEKMQLDQLGGYLTQNPLEAYKLLVEHVRNEEKRQKNNR